MLKFITHKDNVKNSEWIETNLKGKELLTAPLLNKGTAFTLEERVNLGLLGKLPQHVETLDEQLTRAQNQYQRYSNPLQQYIYLNNLHDTNEVLFYKLLLHNLAQTLPLIYTPGVSAAVREFSEEFRQPRGLYISYPDQDKIEEILDNRTHSDIDIIVATDGERILGIGDQGIGGMDIPIAKLVVYSLCGLNPYRTLPVMLDVGTDNPSLLNNSLYLGWREHRIRGQAYDEFIARFIKAVHKKLPNCFLHWEDFGINNARRILETYRSFHCSFNDDMQGTGVVTLAALLSAIRFSKVRFKDQRIIIFGAGTAGVGVADQLYSALIREGVSEKEARAQFWLVDKMGVLHQSSENLATFQHPYASCRALENATLDELIDKIKPTILIGCSTVTGAFNESVVRKMSTHVAHPIIFPLSNPNENAEASPQDLAIWSSGRALIATGSPFGNIHYLDKTYPVTQCNNALAFPGIGLGVILSGAHQVTDNMLWAAAQAISHEVSVPSNELLPMLLPSIETIPLIAQRVALAVAKAAIEDNVARHVFQPEELNKALSEQIWLPYYRPIKYKAKN